MTSQTRETLIGAVVIGLGAAVIGTTYGMGGFAGQAKNGDYAVTASFARIDGLGIGSQVRVGGVPIGQVSGHALTAGYRAVVTMTLAPEVQVPTDTAAVIQSDGLLGAKFIELIPGGDDATVPAGGEIRHTQGSVVLEDLLENILARARARATDRKNPAPDTGTNAAPLSDGTVPTESNGTAGDLPSGNEAAAAPAGPPALAPDTAGTGGGGTGIGLALDGLRGSPGEP